MLGFHQETLAWSLAHEDGGDNHGGLHLHLLGLGASNPSSQALPLFLSLENYLVKYLGEKLCIEKEKQKRVKEKSAGEDARASFKWDAREFF